MTKFTVLGASGFIGSHLAAAIRRRGHSVWTPGRDDDISAKPAGHVFYCIGVTAEFRKLPFETVEAHVTKLSQILRNGSFQSLIYLSSTRVYLGHTGPVDENASLLAEPARLDDLYKISKLAGEALALHSGRPVRVVRISNVYGRDFRSGAFLPLIIESSLTTRTIRLESAPESERDWISIDDVVELLPRIAVEGTCAMYNLASGRNLTNGEIAERVAALTGAVVHSPHVGPKIMSPPIGTSRIQAEFPFRPASLLDDLPALIADYADFHGVRPCS